jgi:hypothetical protein
VLLLSNSPASSSRSDTEGVLGRQSVPTRFEHRFTAHRIAEDCVLVYGGLAENTPSSAAVLAEAIVIRTWSQPIQKGRRLSAPTDQIADAVSHRGRQEHGRQGIRFDLT